MLYTAQIRLEGDNVAGGLAEVWQWLRLHEIQPGPFRYTIGAKCTLLQLEFASLDVAADFAAAFAGQVLGVKPVISRDTRASSGSSKRRARIGFRIDWSLPFDTR
jgi:hypothetical protein